VPYSWAHTFLEFDWVSREDYTALPISSVYQGCRSSEPLAQDTGGVGPGLAGDPLRTTSYNGAKSAQPTQLAKESGALGWLDILRAARSWEQPLGRPENTAGKALPGYKGWHHQAMGPEISQRAGWLRALFLELSPSRVWPTAGYMYGIDEVGTGPSLLQVVRSHAVYRRLAARKGWRLDYSAYYPGNHLFRLLKDERS
jgi:hypothetical protein